MKLRWMIVFLVVVCAGKSALAQVGVYGKFDYTRYSESGQSTLSFTGGGLGVYDDFLHLGPASVGLDLRGDLVSQDKYSYRTLLGGVRVAVRVPLVGVRPYVQGSVGVGGTKSKGPFAVGITGASYNNKLTYEGMAGVDARVLPHVDWRVVELAVGSQNKIDSSAPTLFNVSTGLVARF